MDSERIETLLGGYRPPPPSERVRDAVLAEARRRLGGTLERPSRAARILLAAAAALFLLVVLLPLVFPAGPPAPGAPEGQRGPSEEDLAAQIDGFVRGQEALRPAIVKAGAKAILLLRDAREKAPDRVDLLLFEIKKSLAAPGETALAVAFGEVGILRLEAREDPEKVDFHRALDLLPEKIQPLLDPLIFQEMKPFVPVSLKPEKGPFWHALDSICRQVGFDYGFFYGHVLVSTPARLWPERPRLSAALGEKDADRARRWVESLKSDKVEDRASAEQALKSLGRGVLTVLKESLGKSDPEQVARIRDLIAVLDPAEKPGLFGTPAADRQKLQGADAHLLETLKKDMVSFKAAGIVMDGTLRLLLQPRQVPFHLSPALKTAQVTIDMQNTDLWAILGITCHSAGFDFMIRGGTLWVDTKEEIERMVGK